MHWFLEEKIEPNSMKIKHGEDVLFLGSCFSDNICEKGKEAGLSFQNTKFGTLFHPIPMARVLSDALLNDSENRVFERNGRYYSWDASSKFNHENQATFQKEIAEEKLRLRKKLTKAKFLFLTFGTAKGYTLDNQFVVANCHKMPAQIFNSELTNLSEMKNMYISLISEVKVLNPQVQIVLTVSPVRHAKDGLVTNNRSKARLLMLCEELALIDNVSYFPAYEIVLDQLRDYRFYKNDLVHPNELAIDYVWNIFQETFLTDATIKLNKEIVKRRRFFAHLPINHPTDIEKALYAKKEAELKVFLSENSEIIW